MFSAQQPAQHRRLLASQKAGDFLPITSLVADGAGAKLLLTLISSPSIPPKLGLHKLCYMENSAEGCTLIFNLK